MNAIIVCNTQEQPVSPTLMAPASMVIAGYTLHYAAEQPMNGGPCQLEHTHISDEAKSIWHSLNKV